MLSGALVMDALTFRGGQLPEIDVDYDGEMIVLATANVANSTVSWTAQRDGFFLGFMSNLASGFAIGINVDLPATAGSPAAGSVTPGLIAWQTATVQFNALNDAPKIGFVTGDVIKIRTLGATSLIIQLFLGYRRNPTQTPT